MDRAAHLSRAHARRFALPRGKHHAARSCLEHLAQRRLRPGGGIDDGHALYSSADHRALLVCRPSLGHRPARDVSFHYYFLKDKEQKMARRSKCFELTIILSALLLLVSNGLAQERRAKLRISNAGFTITALPLLAAKDWGSFSTNGLDVELIVMSPPIAAAALAQGDIDYVAGVGPASVAATLSGLQSRAIWFSSDRISYWLQAPSPYKTLQDLKGKKIAISGGAGGTNHVALLIALEKSGANPKDYTMVGIPGQQLQVYYSLESGFVEAALLSPPVTFSAAK